MVMLLRKGRFGPYLDIMLEAALLISFFGFLRVGEFTSATKTFDLRRDLRIADIRLNKESLIIRIRRSKTDKEGKGVAVPIARNNTMLSCLIIPAPISVLGTPLLLTSPCSRPAQTLP